MFIMIVVVVVISVELARYIKSLGMLRRKKYEEGLNQH